MWLFFCVLILILIGIIFSKIDINLKKIELNKQVQDFNVEVKILFFGFINICKINFLKR
jgi:hypothetical protein